MIDECNKAKVSKKCPSSCNICSDEAAEENPEDLGSHWVEIHEEDEEEEDTEEEEIWDEIEEDTEESVDDGDDSDNEAGDEEEVGTINNCDIDKNTNELNCECLVTIMHKKHHCYNGYEPNFGKYDPSDAAQYHQYCHGAKFENMQKERKRKHCCRAAASFREIRRC